MKVTHTTRGFELIENQGCYKLQQSSAMGDYEDAWDKPGSSFLWFGEEHLNREQVRDYLKQDLIPEPLVEHCEAWLETGSLIITPLTAQELRLKARLQIALHANKKLTEFIRDLRNLHCIQWAPCDNASDYQCRYCHARTKTNLDYTIQHYDDCIWLRLEKDNL